MKSYAGMIKAAATAAVVAAALTLAPGALSLVVPPCGWVGLQCCEGLEVGGASCAVPGGRPVQCTDGTCRWCGNIFEPFCRGVGGGPDFCAPELVIDSAGFCICPRTYGEAPCAGGFCRPGLEPGVDGLCGGVNGCGAVGSECCDTDPEPSCAPWNRPVQCTTGICEQCANVGEPFCRGIDGGPNFCAPDLEIDDRGICICPRTYGEAPCLSNTCRPGFQVSADGLCTGVGGCGKEGAACCDTYPEFECRNVIGLSIDGTNSRQPLQCSPTNVCEACGKAGQRACINETGGENCEGRLVVVDGMCLVCGGLGDLVCEPPLVPCDEGLVERGGRCAEAQRGACGGHFQECCFGRVCKAGLKCFEGLAGRPDGLCILGHSAAANNK